MKGEFFKGDGEPYKAAYEREQIAVRRAQEQLRKRYTQERNRIARLLRQVRRLQAVRSAAYQYVEARANISDTAEAARMREGCFARLRFALLTCKRAEAMADTLKRRTK